MTYRAIVAGVGAQGRQWLRVLDAAGDWEIAACVDASPASLETAAASISLPPERRFGSLDAALDAVPSDAVFIAAPPWAHADLVVQSLRAGRHVLLEKPLAGSWADGVRIYQAARQSDRVAMVSQNRRFASPTRTLARVVQSGELGKLNYAFVKFRAYSNQVGNYRAELPHFVLLERAAHLFDQIRAILGLRPVGVLAKTWNPGWSWSKGDACALVHFEFEQGVRATCFVDWIAHENESDYLGNFTVEGERGSASAAHGKVWKSSAPGKAEEVPLLPTKATSQLALEDSLEVFTRALATGERPETSVEDNVGTFAMICASIRSVETGREVAIADLLTDLGGEG